MWIFLILFRPFKINTGSMVSVTSVIPFPTSFWKNTHGQKNLFHLSFNWFHSILLHFYWLLMHQNDKYGMLWHYKVILPETLHLCGFLECVFCYLPPSYLFKKFLTETIQFILNSLISKAEPPGLRAQSDGGLVLLLFRSLKWCSRYVIYAAKPKITTTFAITHMALLTFILRQNAYKFTYF